MAVPQLRGTTVSASPATVPGGDRELPYFTTTVCPQCGAVIDGLDHRYVCTLCEWVSPPEGESPTWQPE